MTESSKKNRIIFIDLMRAFAVLQMVQGHTIDALLSDSYRNYGYPLYSAWLFMRGMTAPIFMFSAGTVFVYLFRLINKPFKDNPRVIKGIKRFFLLIFIGYLLRYPTATLFDFSNVSEKSWNIFFSVDVLHLIGFSLLLLIALSYIAEKLKLNDTLIFGSAGIIFFLLYPFIYQIDWDLFLPQFLAGYFYTKTGSLFPLFPWAGYVIFGGILGSYLAKNPDIFRSEKFSSKLGIIGAALFILFIIINEFYKLTGNKIFFNYSILFQRVGLVLILNAVISYISIELKSIPRFIILIGRNTLLIYIVHLMILYGSAWNPGLNRNFAHSFNLLETLSAAFVMLLAMTFMVIVVNKLKIKNKQLVTQ